MLAAGLLAKKAVERGLTVNPAVKASLAPGSRVVTDYLDEDRPPALPGPARLQWSATAAPPASAIPGRWHPAIEEAVVEERFRRRLRALRQPQFRGAGAPEHQGELPDVAAAGGRLCAGRAGSTSTCRASRSARGRTARTSTCGTSGRRCRKCATRCGRPSGRRSSAGSTPTSRPRTRNGTRFRPPPATSTPSTPARPTSRSRPFFANFSPRSPARSPRSPARGRWACSATR